MSGAETAACLAVLALAAFAQGVFGLGFAMIATPLLALFLDYQAAVFLAAVPLLVLALSWLVVNRRMLRGAGVPLTLVPGIVVGAIAGVWLQFSLPERASLLLLAVLLSFSLCLPWLMGRLRADISRPTLSAAPAFGLLAGITEAALNVGAPFMVLFGGLGRLSRLQQLVALNLCFCVGKSIQVGLMLATAPVPAPAAPLLAGIGLCMVVYQVGDHLAGRYAESVFRRAMSGFLTLMIAALVVRSVFLS